MTPVSHTIVFNILNGAATQLPELHNLSDAGAGKDLMHLTPTRDSELICSGRALTPLTVAPPATPLTARGLLGNGGISPAVLTRGLLRGLAKRGYRVAFRSFNFGVARPQPGHSDWYDSAEHYGGFDASPDQLIEQALLPELTRQARSGHLSVLAECGVGGTTFSTLWLRLLTGLTLTPAGSTKDSAKLARKQQLLSQLQREYRQQRQGFCADTLLGNPRFHDAIQRAVYRLLRHWPQDLPLPRLAGGMMFVAPLLAAHRARPDLTGSVDTTRWVTAGEGQAVLAHLPEGWRLRLNCTDFNRSPHRCLNLYEQGLVVEGCGLGGCLVLAEQLGLDQDEIIGTLNRAVTEHMNQFG
ncbi:hypothetical protein FCL40_03700 [Ferrimonas sediminicola]|uniref:Uncharacterized protein n=1 Tax=Ferrimonas sediminicola TaxID=2569538 RepID=A0A4U1BG31_9GAMM|nr:hypothetical protein [Ferrimonas sediminicola]TKB50278.1 hypothetical protein FCL40_03700 [Ferrimonas sediminicola]